MSITVCANPSLLRYSVGRELAKSTVQADDKIESAIPSRELLLVERAKNGDTQACRELVESCQDRLLAVALGLVGNRQDAEDLAQETFLKAFRSLSHFRGESSWYTWLYRILHNLNIDFHRRKYRQTEQVVSQHSALDARIELSGGDGDLRFRPDDPERIIERQELGARMKKAFFDLSPEHRAVVVLREVDGLSYAEISDATGVSKGTVMSRLFHARKKLQAQLSDLMNGPRSHVDFVPSEDSEMERCSSKGGL